MEEELILKAKRRDLVGKKVKKLREQGLLPAVTYGKDIKPENLVLDLKEFEKVFKKAGETTLVSLIIDNEAPKKVLIQEPQYHPITGKLLHVDLHQIKLAEKIRTKVPLKFVGEAPAVKSLGGTLITSKDELEIECLPVDLPHEIEVDISSLETFEDNIHVKDLKISDKITILDDKEEVIASVAPPRTEEELKELEEKPVEAVEEVEEVKEKEEEKEEGSKEEKEE